MYKFGFGIAFSFQADKMLVMQKRFLVPLFVLSASLFASESEESLALRRIRLLFQEEEYAYAEKAIEEFFQRFPDSLENERLNALQGDIAFDNGDFEKALVFYQKVTGSIFQKEIQSRKWHSLFALSRYREIIEDTSRFCEKDDQALFWLAQATYLIALEQPDNKKELLIEAAGHYKRLEKTSQFALEAKEAQATIYKELGQEGKVQEVLEDLAEALLAKKEPIPEELALKTGRLLARTKPHLARSLFKRLIEKSDLAIQKQAAFLYFSLLVKERDLECLAASEKEIEPLLKPDELALLKVALGSLSSSKKEFAKAVSYYESALELPLNPPYDRQAVHGLVFASKMAHATSSLEKAYAECQKRFPGAEEDLGRIELVLASAYRDDERYSEAETLLDSALSKGLSSEELILEKIRLLALQKRIFEASEYAKAALTKLPKNKAIHDARIALLTNAASSGLEGDFEKLRSEAIKQALLHGELFTDAERFNLELMLARSLLQQNKTREANLLLEELVEHGMRSGELYALTAFALFKEGRVEKGVQFGELALEEELLEEKEARARARPLGKSYAHSLYLPLFNAYLALSKEKGKNRGAHSLESKAGQHLYNAISAGLMVSSENRAWLFRKLSARARLFGMKEEALKALAILDPVLKEASCPERFEAEVVTSSALLGILEQPEKGSRSARLACPCSGEQASQIQRGGRPGACRTFEVARSQRGVGPDFTEARARSAFELCSR